MIRMARGPCTVSGKEARRMTNPLTASIPLGLAAMFLALPATAQDGDVSSEMRPLGNCQGCLVEAQDFSDRKLMGIDLGEAQLTATAFDRAGLGIAIFDGAVLTDVSFDGAGLRGASFVGARLTGVTFDGADLRGAVFEGAILERTDLAPALLCNTQMPDDEMENSDCN
jgi:uncharacterized protein YjbI with pentapeptide repeats